MSIRYLEIDSTFRDRSKWINTSEFEVPISQSGIKGKFDAFDPISLATPILCWTSNNFNKLTNNRSIDVTILDTSFLAPLTIILPYINTNDYFVISAPVNTLHTEKNYYTGAVVTNTTLNISRRIVSYEWVGNNEDGTERAIIILDNGFGDNYQNGDNLVINDPTDFTDINYPYLFVPNGQNGTDRYINYIIYNESKNEYRKIKSYTGSTKLLLIDNSIPFTWDESDRFCLRKEPPLSFSIIQNATINSVTISNTESNIENFYYHMFIRMTSGIAKDEIRQITKYDVITKTVYINKPFLSGIPLIGDSYEILNFSKDNAAPLIYTGSLLSQQEESCYEIELMNLVVPNRALLCGYGDKLSHYPYIYVELKNVSGSSSGSKNIIYSNNPNSTNALFRVVVYDTTDISNSSFLKLNGGGMVQTIKFRPCDTLKFTVRLSNNELYKIKEFDTTSPSEPNPFLQISACFAIKKIN
jgi:hypothetical protein